MFTAVDVQYSATTAFAACVQFDEWTSREPCAESVIFGSTSEPYIPGQFYLRELPCVLQVIGALKDKPTVIVIDGYVWLSEKKPGMGQHLYEALNSSVPVIGVAKNAFEGNTVAKSIWRGKSGKPLYITASGIDPDHAAMHISAMHGAHRIPTLLKRVDALCRAAASNRLRQ
jgi:deoxyribonuclease V